MRWLVCDRGRPKQGYLRYHPGRERASTGRTERRFSTTRRARRLIAHLSTVPTRSHPPRVTGDTSRELRRGDTSMGVASPPPLDVTTFEHAEQEDIAMGTTHPTKLLPMYLDQIVTHVPA